MTLPTFPPYFSHIYAYIYPYLQCPCAQVPVFPVSYYAPSYPHYYLPAVQQKVAGAEAEDVAKVAQTVPYLPSILSFPPRSILFCASAR